MGGNLHTPVLDQPSHRASPRNTTDASTGGCLLLQEAGVLTCLLDPAPGVRRGVPSTLPQAPN